ncbi:MAG: hypothetical protein R3Y64_09975 [Peptostreptococcaceae bacterium]
MKKSNIEIISKNILSSIGSSSSKLDPTLIAKILNIKVFYIEFKKRHRTYL